MGLADTAKLLASLDLDTKPFERGAARAGQTMGRMETRFSKIGSIAQKGLGNAVTNVKRLGAAAAAFVGVNVFKGIDSLATLEDAITAVDGAIRQTGKTGQVTGQQIATWANEIEESVQRAFDDKEITQAATTLIRYGNVATENLRPALVVMTDLAAKTGSVESASTLLAKALADPEKAAGKLARTGVVLTKEQQKQITAMVKAGKTAKAQAFLLQLLEERTKGAAAAAKGPYRDALNILADVTEDAQRALGEAFLPVLGKVADKLSKFLADPKNVERIREFGRGLASGFEKLLGLVDKIPFDQIGTSLRIAGAGAKALFDAFTSLPPWVQTAVLTGWGLNKLTGGAIGDIVGELGKGLIKGVLGINAGVVNINAATVNGGGLPGGAAGGAAAGFGAVGVAGIAGAAIVAGNDSAVIAKGVADGYNAAQKGDVQGLVTATKDIVNGQIAIPQVIKDLITPQLTAIEQKIAPAFDPVAFRAEERSLDLSLHKNLQPLPDNITKKQKAQFDAVRDKLESGNIASRTRLDQNKASLERVRERAAAIQTATTGAGNKMAAASDRAADRIVRAIYATKNTPVAVTLSIRGGAAATASAFFINRKTVPE